MSFDKASEINDYKEIVSLYAIVVCEGVVHLYFHAVSSNKSGKGYGRNIALTLVLEQFSSLDGYGYVSDL